MSESTRKGMVYAALVLAIIWAAYNFFPDDKKGAATDPTADSQAAAALAPAIPTPKSPIDVAEMKKVRWGDDPFHTPARTMPKSTKPESHPIWDLSGIVYNAQNPLAIINDKAVRVGDIIDNAEIIKIEKKSVTLQYRGKRIQVTVAKG